MGRDKKFDWGFYKYKDKARLILVKTELIKENKLDMSDVDLIKSAKLTEDQAYDLHIELQKELT